MNDSFLRLDPTRGATACRAVHRLRLGGRPLQGGNAAGPSQADGFFSGRIFSGHEMPRSKPAPDVYLAAAAHLGAAGARCLEIEDTPTGITAGVARAPRSGPIAHRLNKGRRCCRPAPDQRELLNCLFGRHPVAGLAGQGFQGFSLGGCTNLSTEAVHGVNQANITPPAAHRVPRWSARPDPGPPGAAPAARADRPGVAVGVGRSGPRHR